MFARFWWGSSDDNKKIYWMSWQNMCLPKEIGGINFRDIEGFNQALLAKQVWRVLKNHNLLIAKVLKARYLPTCHVLDTTGLSSSSYFWKSFVWGKDLLIQGLWLRVGDGNSIMAFSDPWLPRPSTFRPITPVFTPEYEFQSGELYFAYERMGPSLSLRFFLSRG